MKLTNNKSEFEKNYQVVLEDYKFRRIQGDMGRDKQVY